MKRREALGLYIIVSLSALLHLRTLECTSDISEYPQSVSAWHRSFPERSKRSVHSRIRKSVKGYDYDYDPSEEDDGLVDDYGRDRISNFRERYRSKQRRRRRNPEVDFDHSSSYLASVDEGADKSIPADLEENMMVPNSALVNKAAVSEGQNGVNASPNTGRSEQRLQRSLDKLRSSADKSSKIQETDGNTINKYSAAVKTISENQAETGHVKVSGDSVINLENKKPYREERSPELSRALATQIGVDLFADSSKLTKREDQKHVESQIDRSETRGDSRMFSGNDLTAKELSAIEGDGVDARIKRDRNSGVTAQSKLGSDTQSNLKTKKRSINLQSYQPLQELQTRVKKEGKLTDSNNFAEEKSTTKCGADSAKFAEGKSVTVRSADVDELQHEVEAEIRRKIESIKEDIRREVEQKQRIRGIDRINDKYDQLRSASQNEQEDYEQKLKEKRDTMEISSNEEAQMKLPELGEKGTLSGQVERMKRRDSLSRDLVAVSDATPNGKVSKLSEEDVSNKVGERSSGVKEDTQLTAPVVLVAYPRLTSNRQGRKARSSVRSSRKTSKYIPEETLDEEDNDENELDDDSFEDRTARLRDSAFEPVRRIVKPRSTYSRSNADSRNFLFRNDLVDDEEDDEVGDYDYSFRPRRRKRAEDLEMVRMRKRKAKRNSQNAVVY